MQYVKEFLIAHAHNSCPDQYFLMTLSGYNVHYILSRLDLSS